MRHRRVWGYVLAGFFTAVVLGLVAVAVLTRTVRGRDRILDFTLERVGGRLNGSLDVGRLDGNLITGARIFGLELRGRDGELVVAADSADVNYELATFFGGDVVLNDLVLYDSKISLRRLPGDTLWNYQEILLDTTKVPGEGPARATLLDRVRLVNSDITVRLPWEPEKELSGPARAVAIRDALSDTSRLEVAAVPRGFVRTMLFRVREGRISNLVISAEERGGTYLRIDTITALARLYRGKLLDVRQARGELALRGGMLRFRAPTVVLPSSRIEAVGTIDLNGEEPRYDLTVASPRVALADLEWLYPHMPERGTAGFKLWMETRPEGTLYRVRDLTFAAPGTRMVGSFGMVINGSLRFSEVDLRAEPLRVETIEEMLPAGLPVRGLHIGAVEIRSSRAPPPGVPATSRG